MANFIFLRFEKKKKIDFKTFYISERRIYSIGHFRFLPEITMGTAREHGYSHCEYGNLVSIGIRSFGFPQHLHSITVYLYFSRLSPLTNSSAEYFIHIYLFFFIVLLLYPSVQNCPHIYLNILAKFLHLLKVIFYFNYIYYPWLLC